MINAKRVQESQNIYDFFSKFVSISSRSEFFFKYELRIPDFIKEMEEMSSFKQKELSEDVSGRHQILKVIHLTHAKFGRVLFKDFLWTLFHWNINDSNIDVVKSALKASGFQEKVFLYEHQLEFNNNKRKSEIPYTTKLGYDRVIGRDEEIRELILALKRMKKNNPVLVGKAGVGKTAIVEKLNYLLMNKKVPLFLKDYKVLSLNLLEIASGAKFKGDIEKRFNEVLNKIKNKNIILFIDEIHSLRSFDDVNLLNYLKPMLDRGNLKIIGATTLEEWNIFVKKDEALERRFSKIYVKEPSIEKTFEILNKVKSSYEKNHKISYEELAIKEIIKSATKYDRFRANPDKSLDYLDLIGSLGYLEKRKKITLKYVKNFFKNKFNIETQDIDKFLKKKVLQQDQIIDKLSVYIKAYEKDLNNKNLPIGSFLFVGNSGTGKTFLSKEISNYLGFNFSRIDMSEFKHSSDVNKLLGSPSGYVGYNDSSLLDKCFQKSSQNVFLFDEIDKAHKDVFDIFLQIMDYGKLTLSNGKMLDFRNCIIIFTSNKFTKKTKAVGLVGKSKINSIKKDDLGFSNELISRLSDIYLFNDLENNQNYVSSKLIEILEQRNLSLKFNEDVLNFISKKLDKNFGARELDVLFDQYFLKELIKEDDIEKLNLIKVENDQIIFS